MSKVDEYILELPKSIKEIVIHARNIILKSHPSIKESFKYKCPFYDYKKNLCYIYTKNNTVIIGFVQGKILAKKIPSLKGAQKQIRHYIITEMNSVLENELKFILQEAISLNDDLFREN